MNLITHILGPNWDIIVERETDVYGTYFQVTLGRYKGSRFVQGSQPSKTRRTASEAIALAEEWADELPLGKGA